MLLCLCASVGVCVYMLRDACVFVRSGTQRSSISKFKNRAGGKLEVEGELIIDFD